MTIDLDRLLAEATHDFAGCADITALEREKAKYLGSRQGVLNEHLRNLGRLPPEERKSRGEALNQARQAIETSYAARRDELAQERLQERLNVEALDVTAPGRIRHRGALHPVTLTQERVETLFAALGFVVADGPEIESDDYNFTALNTPADHPARSMHDTFYLQDDAGKVATNVLLRTHTSPIQARYLRAHVARYRGVTPMPEIRVIAPGRVYRVDSDATHSPMFHQLEGLWVGSSISFADLKGVLDGFLRAFFEDDHVVVRFRPSFFPFTEPSAEIDIAFADGPNPGKWLEVLGCGMVHPNVLAMAGIDPEHYTGFAFGLGLDRMAMLRYGINDLRLMFTGDLRFLSQFASCA